MRPFIPSIEVLLTNQAVASSVVPVTLGSSGAGNNPFQMALRIGDRIAWELIALFTLGATGGFRFLANGPAAVTTYNAQFTVVDLTTPTTFNNGQSAEAAFANASAVAGTYQLRARGTVINGAAADVFAFQFAQNTSDVLPITILAGATFKVWQF